METDQTTLPPLEIAHVSIIASYGWKERFAGLDEAMKFVETITDLVEDPATPLDQIQVMVEFITGESERCAYQNRERTLQWMGRFRNAVSSGG